MIIFSFFNPLPLCQCDRPESLRFYPDELPNNNLKNTDIIIMTCNRPRSLYKSLRSILNAYGVDKTRIWVMVDGYDYADETKDIAKLLGVNWKLFNPRGVNKARITQHYGSVLKWIFHEDRSATSVSTDQVIIFEDDLEVSRDIFNYFSQTLPILKIDPSLWCISAWNDHGFTHTTGSDSQTYRVEGTPGLGWLMTKNYFKSEIEDIWPSISEKNLAWNDWLKDINSKARKECIIPDVPRVFHFPSKNKAQPNKYQDEYYNRKDFLSSSKIQSNSINDYDDSPVKLENLDRLVSDKYEDHMYKLIGSSLLVDHSISPCSENFMQNANPNNTYIAYFRMQHDTSTDVFLNLAKCLKIWDVDVRGLHKGSLKLYINKAPVIFIGSPASPYSIHKPQSVIAYYI